MDNNIISGFKPIIDSSTKILILGTLPGRESLKQGSYYADKNNLFWDIIYRILDSQWDRNKLVNDHIDFPDRYSFILSHKIGIWDVLACAERGGSSDSKIKNEGYNDFRLFFEKHEAIDSLIFNGEKAYYFYKREFPYPIQQFNINILYSTSPQNSVNSFYILSQWEKTILKLLT